MPTKHKDRIEDPHDVLIATAPYNFIPLPERWVPAGLDQQASDHDCYVSDRLSGFIVLGITALTPIFVRGTWTPEEYQIRTSKGDPESRSDFFQPAERPCIPGSTLR